MVGFGLVGARSHAQESGWTGTNSLRMPHPGEHALTILHPQLLELTMISGQPKPGDPVEPWDFVGPNFQLRLPNRAEFQVIAGENRIQVKEVGFKRRPLYAPV